MALADHVLALHKDIHEVLILEDREGNHVVVGEASRKGVTLLADSMNVPSKKGLLAPMIILGSANQFGGQQSKLVGIEYEEAGLVLAPLSESRLLAISTKPESLRDVWETVSAALPQLEQHALEIPTAPGGVTSAAEAENRARYFLTERYPRYSSRIMVSEVSYRRVDEQWEVHGSFRSGIWSRSRRFLVEVDARDGSVKRFIVVPPPPLSSPYFSTPSPYVLAATACVIAASLLALMLFAGFWKY